ncbi:MAG: hypothetical protein H6597_03150 [Flavobacteriales bacterium]|nr:hypothetical protein [Flavobacteriales bacterium]MCB9193503.1 hypothetical protein [Flavobacteriales bacterium]
MPFPLRPVFLALTILAVACTPVHPPDEVATSPEANGWTMERSLTKTIDNFTFHFPAEGYAYAHRDSLVEACMQAIARNKAVLDVDSFSVPYTIVFYPSKAAMKQAIHVGVSGHADYWTKQVGFVATDDPATVEKENIIPPPIAHETMHMIAMEKWGYPPESSLWMNEGLATYAHNNCNGRTVREIGHYLQARAMTYPMDSLVQRFHACDEMIAYHQSAGIVQYLLEHDGLEQFGRLWQEGFPAFAAIYGMPFPEMEARIRADLAQAYPDGVAIDWETFRKGCK